MLLYCVLALQSEGSNKKVILKHPGYLVEEINDKYGKWCIVKSNYMHHHSLPAINVVYTKSPITENVYYILVNTNNLDKPTLIDKNVGAEISIYKNNTQSAEYTHIKQIVTEGTYQMNALEFLKGFKDIKLNNEQIKQFQDSIVYQHAVDLVINKQTLKEIIESKKAILTINTNEGLQSREFKSKDREAINIFLNHCGH
ncbi:MAG: hypothetical protein J0H68_01205 [Sphingobacteriia bacterium]|nr:hypothetical protein [Sphingobacteriia bacterium]